MTAQRWRQWADEVAAIALDGMDDGPLAWQDRALCIQVDPDLHFPERGASTKEAKRVCFACEVRTECLAYAMEKPALSAFGVWGGKSERQRRRIRREQQARDAA